MNNIKNRLDYCHDNDNILITSNKVFGFWLYLMSDCIIFAVLFSIYIVMKNSVSNNMLTQEIFHIPLVMLETFCLLISSLSCGMLSIFLSNTRIKPFYVWSIITWFFGLTFIIIDVFEFYDLIEHGFNPVKNSFFSSFFVLVGMHAVHVLAGLMWLIVIIYQVFIFGLNESMKIRVISFSLFWHFLDIIWICVFTFVYLLGVL